MLEQNIEGARHLESRVAVDEASGPEACSRDELTERCVTGRGRGILARAREEDGARILPRSVWSTGDPGAA